MTPRGLQLSDRGTDEGLFRGPLCNVIHRAILVNLSNSTDLHRIVHLDHLHLPRSGNDENTMERLSQQSEGFGFC